MTRGNKGTLLAALLCAALLLPGCGGGGETASGGEAEGAAGDAVQLMDSAALFSGRDKDPGYDAAAAVTVQLGDGTAVCASDAVAVDGGRITLLEEGVYLFSGALEGGQIVVDAGSGDKVQIVLSGAEISSADSAALYCLEADKVFLTLAEGTENVLANGGTFANNGGSNIDAAVFSRTDLTLNGGGSLTVRSPAGHGIVSKDELTITGGAYTITAARHGLSGKDSVAIAGGSFAITSGKDGVHAEDADDASGGLLYIGEGSFAIDAQGDAVSASGPLQIDGGSFGLTAGGGSESAEMKTGDDMMQRPGFRSFPGGEASDGGGDSAGETESCKGLKAGGALAVTGGTFTLDTADDGVHAGGAILLAGGTWSIRTGDDGVHSDSSVEIRGGTYAIPYCYEGVEGQSVTINGGTLDIVAHDDGLNAAGGADSSGTDFGFGRQDRFAADENCFITVNGGGITIVSDGDCIDSNGALTVNGGTLHLTCNGNGNTAIDAGGTFANNGGSITTNDGSESGTGGMPGGKGGMGDMDDGRGGMDGRGGEKPQGEGGENAGMPSEPVKPL